MTVCLCACLCVRLVNQLDRNQKTGKIAGQLKRQGKARLLDPRLEIERGGEGKRKGNFDLI